MIDRAEIHVKAGDGGHGLISFRREKFVPRCGPDGGDGGRGGDVVLVADRGVNGLGAFRYKRQYKADRGGNGAAAKKHGRNGADMELKVPPGTIVRKDGEVAGDLAAEGERLVVAKGGTRRITAPPPPAKRSAELAARCSESVCTNTTSAPCSLSAPRS